MRIKCDWKSGMVLSATNGVHDVVMDGKKPFGAESAMSPKELVIAGLCGCTAMDVVGLLKKHKQTLEALSIEAEVDVSKSGHPIVFSKVMLNFRLMGSVDPGTLLESIRLSQSQYCGVSAMLSRSVPIEFTVELNGQQIGAGRADFSDALASSTSSKG